MTSSFFINLDIAIIIQVIFLEKNSKQVSNSVE